MLATQLHLLLAGLSVGISLAMILLVAGDRGLDGRVRALVADLACSGAAHSLRTVEAWADWGAAMSALLTSASVLGVPVLWQIVRVLFGERRGWAAFIAWSLMFLGAQLAGRLVLGFLEHFPLERVFSTAVLPMRMMRASGQHNSSVDFAPR